MWDMMRWMASLGGGVFGACLMFALSRFLVMGWNEGLLLTPIVGLVVAVVVFLNTAQRALPARKASS